VELLPAAVNVYKPLPCHPLTRHSSHAAWQESLASTRSPTGGGAGGTTLAASGASQASGGARANVSDMRRPAERRSSPVKAVMIMPSRLWCRMAEGKLRSRLQQQQSWHTARLQRMLSNLHHGQEDRLTRYITLQGFNVHGANRTHGTESDV
jgi:hypothetical protein